MTNQINYVFPVTGKMGLRAKDKRLEEEQHGLNGRSTCDASDHRS